MKHLNEIRLMPNQSINAHALSAHQVGFIAVVGLLSLTLIFYGYILLALLLGAFTLAVILNKTCQGSLCEKHGIKSVIRLMSSADLPADLKVETYHRNRQKRLLITSQACLKKPLVILDLTDMSKLNTKDLQNEIQYLQRQNIQVYMIIDRGSTTGEDLNKRMTQLVGVYRIFGTLDHCLEHVRGRLVQNNKISVNHQG